MCVARTSSISGAKARQEIEGGQTMVLVAIYLHDTTSLSYTHLTLTDSVFRSHGASVNAVRHFSELHDQEGTSRRRRARRFAGIVARISLAPTDVRVVRTPAGCRRILV